MVNVESSAENSPEAVVEPAKSSDNSDQPLPGPSDESKKIRSGELYKSCNSLYTLFIPTCTLYSCNLKLKYDIKVFLLF